MKKLFSLLLTLCILCILCSLCIPVFAADATDGHTIVLSTDAATLDGEAVPEYDYTWHADPSADHGEVKNSPAEYYTGTKPSGEDAVYIAHDIFYFPQLEQSKFQKVNYDGEEEWVYFYEAPGYEKYIFCTLPNLKSGFPSHMMHTEDEAYENPVLYITQPGTYTLQGDWHGQIRVDLGEDAFDDETKKVTLILNGANIECTVAPGVVFASVYECDNQWEDRDTHSPTVDTSNAGANVIIADGTVNNVSGTNIFRILRTKYKDDDSTEAYPAQKKQIKMDGAFYSYQSMNITGSTGTLNITSGYEGLNTELHLTINGGNVNIFSQDDGINVNEDDVSVVTVNGGCLHICSGLGAEGDGIDSNGYLTINGGTVISAASQGADAGLDSDKGSYVNGGTVVSLGASMDWATADSSATQAVVNLRFGQTRNGVEAIVITDTDGKVVFAYDPSKDEVLRTEPRAYSGAVLSAPTLHVGSTYRIYIGGEITGTESAGVYDPTTVTAFTGAALQGYSGDTFGNMGGGFRPDGMGQGGGRPEDMDGNEPPQRPQGGNADGNMQTPPDGFDPMGGQQGDQMPGMQLSATCTYQTSFEMTQTVNSFTSVADYRHNLQESDGYYVCTGCGSAFADAEGTILLAGQANQNILPYVLCFLAGCATTAILFGIIHLIRGKKNKKSNLT